MDWPLFATLVALVIVVRRLRDERELSTAAILLLNWCAGAAYCWRTGDSYPWPIFGAFDYVAGFTLLRLLRLTPGPWQIAIAASYAVELVCHGWVGWAQVFGHIGGFSAKAATYYGYHFIHAVAWAQAGIMGAWIGVDMARRGGLSHWRARPSLAGMDRVAGQSRTSAR
jgi:hypothetical protein